VIRGNWWYIGPRNGHASIFTADALSVLAASCGLVLHRGDWLHGFAAADASETSRAILAQVGSPYAWLRLDAPLHAAARDPVRQMQMVAWHGLEQHDSFYYCWTAQSRIRWVGCLPEVHPLQLRIVVPYVNQIVDDFPAGCTIEVGGQVLQPAMRGAQLIAEVTLAEAVENEVVLHTPEPITPRALRDAPDDRPLGLAIAAYPWSPPRRSED